MLSAGAMSAVRHAGAEARGSACRAHFTSCPSSRASPAARGPLPTRPEHAARIARIGTAPAGFSGRVSGHDDTMRAFPGSRVCLGFPRRGARPRRLLLSVMLVLFCCFARSDPRLVLACAQARHTCFALSGVRAEDGASSAAAEQYALVSALCCAALSSLSLRVRAKGTRN